MRRRLDEGAHSPDAGIIGALANWGDLSVFEAFTAETPPFEGTHGGRDRPAHGKEPFDALLDIVVADEPAHRAVTDHARAEPTRCGAARADAWRDRTHGRRWRPTPVRTST